MNNADDLTLIGKVLILGDKRAFDTLTLKYQGFVRRFLRNLCEGDTIFADDLAQETFIKAYLNLQQFKGIANFSTWLTRIAYNTFYDYQRNKKDVFEPIESAALEISQTHTPMENYDFEQLLKTLNPQERAVVLLFYMEDFPIKKIAKSMHIPTGTVKSLLFRSKKKIKNIFENETKI
ncbi:MAG: RNA polymerase sigma factor [Paludibacter sp.]|nr:RNA polymerase sigma factor [Paludibacter sp.]